jgi:hypothetical protein
LHIIALLAQFDQGGTLQAFILYDKNFQRHRNPMNWQLAPGRKLMHS